MAEHPPKKKKPKRPKKRTLIRWMWNELLGGEADGPLLVYWLALLMLIALPIVKWLETL